MNVSARTQRTLMWMLSVFLAAGAGDAIIQYFGDGRYDWHHLLAALVGAAIVAIQQFLQNSGANAPPTVAAVNQTLQSALGMPLVSVPPPKQRLEPLPTITTLPPEKH